ncbi:MAG TPA: 4a-hydroxytetrahydrobiopterin dehydratase [Thermoleophilaceae bacterium]|nr:4a-hydroxytetrahydrobiopterin dehydratase [Thermoleophilaceae bacterium]
MALLEQDEIERRLAGLDGWSQSGDAIAKDFERGDFAGSIALVNEIAPVADELNHHPDLAISWDTVTVTITTHSQGGLTEADFELAGRIEALA